MLRYSIFNHSSSKLMYTLFDLHNLNSENFSSTYIPDELTPFFRPISDPVYLNVMENREDEQSLHDMRKFLDDIPALHDLFASTISYRSSIIM